MKNLIILFVVLFTVSCNENNKNETQMETAEAAVVEDSITNNQASILADSPRHHEWIDLKREDGSVCKAFVVYPESSESAKSVIVIHENRGLNDWAREFADELASNGFLVIAPDLISNTVEGKVRTTDFEDSDKAREAIYALDPDQVTYDLNSAFNYIKNDKASNGKVSVVGFCWGGSQTFRYATNNQNIDEALVFYGTAPEEASKLQTINAPVYGFYGGADNRVTSTVPDTEKHMQDAGKTYEPVIYEGAGHAFMRSGAEEGAEEANKKAHDEAWQRLLPILKDE